MAPKKSAPKKAAPKKAAGKKKLSFEETTQQTASATLETTATTAVVASSASLSAKKAPAAPIKTHKKIIMADQKHSGIVKAETASSKKKKAQQQHDKEEEDDASSSDEEGEEEVDMSSGDESSMLGDDEEVEGATTAPTAPGAKKAAKSCKPYRVLRLRFLPPEFQEPQLTKFLNQFEATVTAVFCVRSKRTHQSKGIAYVQFDDESVLPTVVEEFHGMALGDRAVRAKAVTMKRAMPAKARVDRRRALAYAYKTKGAPLKRYNVTEKNVVGRLLRAAATEKRNNALLEQMNVPYKSDFFISQLAAIPASMLTKKVKGFALPQQNKKEQGGSAEKPAAVTPTRVQKDKKEEAKKETTPSPKSAAKQASPAKTPKSAKKNGKA